MAATPARARRHLIARVCFQEAFEALGGVPALVRWARQHPGDFYKLYAQKLIPTRIEPVAEEGDGLTPLAIQVVFATPPEPRTIQGSAAILSAPRLPAEHSLSREEPVP